jgi:hypothetical protein
MREHLHGLAIILGFVFSVLSALPVMAQPGTHPEAATEKPRFTIEWRVENPFRLFLDPKDTDRHRIIYESLRAEQRAEPILSIEHILAQQNPRGWAAEVVGRTCWDQKSNRHRCQEHPDFTKPRSHRVLAWLNGSETPNGRTCIWELVPIQRQPPRRARSITAPCHEQVTLEVPYPDGAQVGVSVEGGERVETRITVTDLFIIGMGDSFGSGEGNPDVPVEFSRDRVTTYGRFGRALELTGYPAREGAWRAIGDAAFNERNAGWLDQACHRSLYAHQLRVALQLAMEDPHRAVTFVGLACSGAEVTRGLFHRYKGNEWVPNPPDLSQVSAAAQAQCGTRVAPARDYPEAYHMRGRVPELQGGLVLRKCPAEHARKIDLILLSIGGNDIGFSRLVANAVLNDQSVLKRLGGWFGHVYAKADATAPLEELTVRYAALRRAIHNILHVPWNEAERIILTAYPRMALLADGRSICSSGPAGMDVLPAYALNAERARDGEDIAAELNEVMRQSARANSWGFAEDHRERFVGRGICAGAVDRPVALADDLRFPFHVDGRWEPFNPADYQPYAPRTRWFRTPNDAFLTGNFHVTGAILRRVLRQEQLMWTQVLLASTYSGAFHPTAEGHAAIADSVLIKARSVVDGVASPLETRAAGH